MRKHRRATPCPIPRTQTTAMEEGTRSRVHNRTDPRRVRHLGSPVQYHSESISHFQYARHHPTNRCPGKGSRTHSVKQTSQASSRHATTEPCYHSVLHLPCRCRSKFTVYPPSFVKNVLSPADSVYSEVQ